MLEFIRIEFSCSWFLFSVCCQTFYPSITHLLQSWLLILTDRPQTIIYMKFYFYDLPSFVHKLSYSSSLSIFGFWYDNVFYPISFIINKAQKYFEDEDVSFSNKISTLYEFSFSYSEVCTISTSLLNVDKICTLVCLAFFF